MRHQESKRSVGSKIMILAVLAAAGICFTAVRPYAAGWKPRIGETIVYDLTMFHVTLANQTVKVEKMDKQNGANCLLLSSTTKSVPLAKRIMSIDDRTESCVTPDTLVPVAYVNHTSETGWKSNATMMFKPGKIIIDEIRGEKLDEKRHTIVNAPAGVVDDVSIIFNLRGRPMKVGDTFTVKIISDRELQTAKMTVLRREEIKTKIGSRMCYVVNSTFSNSTFWIESSPNRTPLKFEVDTKSGRARGDIKSYDPGK